MSGQFAVSQNKPNWDSCKQNQINERTCLLTMLTAFIYPEESNTGFVKWKFDAPIILLTHKQILPIDSIV